MNRRVSVILAAFVALAGAILPSACAAPVGLEATPSTEPTTPVILTLVFTNDTLGELYPSTRKSDCRLGGLARRATLVDSLRRDDPELLLVDAGGLLFPGYLSTFDYGCTVVNLYNRMGYDASAVGLFDLYFGKKVFLERTSDARFPFLAANANLGLARSLSVEVRGKRVLFIGIVTTRIKELLPQLEVCVKVEDPVIAITSVLAEHGKHPHDLVVVLAAVGEKAAFRIARSLPSLHVIFRVQERSQKSQAEVFYRVDTAGGPTLFCCPKRGTHVGVARIRLGVGRPKVESCRLIPIAKKLRRHPSAAACIRKTFLAFASAHRDSLAIFPEPVATSFPAFVAQIIRTRQRSEIAVVNRGAFQAFPETGSFSRGDLCRIMPFKDDCVQGHMTGAQLKSLYARSEAAPFGRKLVFAGMTKVGGVVKVNGRDLVAAQTYSVATVRYLASGGAGYFKWKHFRTGPGVKAQVTRYLLDVPQPSFSGFKALSSRPFHTLRSELDLSLSRVYKNPYAADYAAKNVPGLTGTEATRMRHALKLTYRRQAIQSRFTGVIDAKYEEVDEEPSVNELKLELLNEGKFRGGRADFISAQIDTTLVEAQTPGASRPFKAKFSLGRSYELRRYWKLRLGASVLKLYSEAASPATYGLDMVMTYERPLLRGLEYRGRLNYFNSYSKFRIDSFDFENSLKIQVRRKLSVVVKADVFLYRDSEIARTAAKNELYVGLRYDMRNKWVGR